MLPQRFNAGRVALRSTGRARKVRARGDKSGLLRWLTASAVVSVAGGARGRDRPWGGPRLARAPQRQRQRRQWRQRRATLSPISHARGPPERCTTGGQGWAERQLWPPDTQQSLVVFDVTGSVSSIMLLLLQCCAAARSRQGFVQQGHGCCSSHDGGGGHAFVGHAFVLRRRPSISVVLPLRYYPGGLCFLLDDGGLVTEEGSVCCCYLHSTGMTTNPSADSRVREERTSRAGSGERRSPWMSVGGAIRAR